MSFLSHDPDDQATDRKAREVLDILDRWDQRFRDRHPQNRRFLRHPYRALLIVVLADETAPPGPPAGPALLRVWARNLSQGGVGFIYPGQLRAERIVVCLDPTAGNVWMRARIVRRCLVHNGFWEYGAKFEGRESSS